MKKITIIFMGLLMYLGTLFTGKITLDNTGVYYRLRDAGFKHFADTTFVNNQLADKELEVSEIQAILQKACEAYRIHAIIRPQDQKNPLEHQACLLKVVLQPFPHILDEQF